MVYWCTTETEREIFFMEAPPPRKVLLQSVEQTSRKNRYAILLTFALPDGNLLAAHVEILYAQGQGFE